MKELTNTKCKWPIGNPQHEDFTFCGGDALEDDSPYCAFHYKMAYRHDYVSRSQKFKNKTLKEAA